MALSDEIDQFITRRLKAGEPLTTELVIRLCNEFPTTEREVREFEQRTKMHADKLDEVVDGMLGSSLGKTLTEQEREQMKTMLREQAEQASQAQAEAEQTVEGRHAARVEFKKKQGNEAFKASEYQVAPGSTGLHRAAPGSTQLHRVAPGGNGLPLEPSHAKSSHAKSS